MAYKSKARRKSVELRQPVEGNGIVMTPNQLHKVSIEVKKIEDEGALFLFNDNFGNRHQEKIFRLNKDASDLSHLLKQLLAATASDTETLKHTYEDFLYGNQVFKSMDGKECIIETEYRGDYINIKTIRRMYDRDNNGSPVQSFKTNNSCTKTSSDTTKSKRYIALPSEAEASF